MAVTALSALPQLGFIHEDSSQAFVLDIADLFRENVTLRIAFSVAKRIESGEDESVDRLVRRTASAEFRRLGVIPMMMDKVKGSTGDASTLGETRSAWSGLIQVQRVAYRFASSAIHHACRSSLMVPC